MTPAITIPVPSLDGAAIQTALADILRGHGWHCEPPDAREHETPAEFCARIGWNPGSLGRVLRNAHPDVELVRAPGTQRITKEGLAAIKQGRLLFIRSNPAFEAFMAKRKAMGRREKRLADAPGDMV